MEALPPASDVGLIRVQLVALREAMLPWPQAKVQALHRVMPQLASGAWAHPAHAFACGAADNRCSLLSAPSALTITSTLPHSALPSTQLCPLPSSRAASRVHW